MENRELKLMEKLISYSNKYEISIQLWPKQKTIYIAKDGVDLHSYGAHDLRKVVEESLKFLDRINKKE